MKDTIENIILFAFAGFVFYASWTVVAYLNL